MRDTAKTELHARHFPLRGVVLSIIAVAVMMVVAAAPATAAGLSTEVADPVGQANTNIVMQSVVNGLSFGLLLALASVGLSLIYGTTGLSNFAHGEQVSFGAVMCYFLTTQQPVSLPLIPIEFTIGWPFIPSAVVAVVIAGGTGWLQNKFLWAPLRRRHVTHVQQMIVSIGLALAVINLMQWWIGGRVFTLIQVTPDKHEFAGISISTTTVYSLIIAIVCLLSVGFFLQRTRIGRATRAVSDNPALAATSGIRVESIIRLVWILAASLAALGGVLFALYNNGSKFDSGARLLLLMFAAVTLGGLGHAFGALIGSIAIGLVAELSTLWLPPDLKIATALVILILVLLVRPQGILGRKERVG